MLDRKGENQANRHLWEPTRDKPGLSGICTNGVMENVPKHTF